MPVSTTDLIAHQNTGRDFTSANRATVVCACMYRYHPSHTAVCVLSRRMTGGGVQHSYGIKGQDGGMPGYGNEESGYASGSSPSSLSFSHAGPSNEGSSSRAMVATRVAKACVPCSTKKRRCDGGKPQCKVCMVLGSDCSYETRGLKRGPPKGFRSGPKESAKAKLLRTLETTIRDLALHMGRDDTEREIVRISAERGIAIQHTPTTTTTASTASNSDLFAKREHSAPAASAAHQSTEVPEDVLGISEQGTVRYIGSSSGIQLIPTAHHPVRPQYSPARSLSHPLHPSPIPLPSVSSARLHGSPSTTSVPSATSATHVVDTGRLISKSMNRRLFHHYWTGFHNFWPILYKPGLDHMDVDRLPEALDVALVYAIYAMAACVAHPTLDNELEAELGDGPAGEVFAQRAEQHLFQSRSTPSPSFASIQCCFILSCYHQGAGQLSKAYLFSCLANGMAIDLGLHRHLHQYEHDRIERESRSRLIHCIHILSTLLSAEMGRPPTLRSKDIDVPPLSEKENDEFDFDTNGRQLHSLSLLNHSRRLFAIVETVLSQVHSFRRKAALRRMGSEGIRQVVDEIDESLEAWRRSLPDWLRLHDDNSTSPVPSFAAVQVWYHTAKILLHRPFIPQDEGLALSDLLNDKYHRKCTQAAQCSFDLLQRLAKASSVDQLSTDLAYIIFTTAVMFVFNARLVQTDGQSGEMRDRSSADEDLYAVRVISSNAKRQFLMCKEWLRKLSDRWPSASAHKQLLDGFAVVGEGVLGGEPHRYVGRRPSLDQEGGSRPMSAGGGALTMAAGARLPSYEASSVAPYSMEMPATTAAYTAGETLGTMAYALDTHNAGDVMSQQSLNAYFEFAPNIFDMENVYWNETATRMTPFIGPRDGGAESGMVAMANADQQQYGPQSGYAAFTPRTFVTAHSTSFPAPQSMAMAPPSSGPRSSRAGLVATTPAKRSRASTGHRSSESDSPGLQMLAHQAVQTTGVTGQQHDNGAAIAMATPHPGGHHFDTNNPSATLAVTNGGGGGNGGMAIASSYSPFSFHQEPSAPEWGDVISMLQLPPAFIQ